MITLVDILTIALVTVVWFALSWVMLRHVVYWTGLGRSLFFFFLFTSVAAAHGTLWRVLAGHQQPEWAAMVFRVPITLSGLGILVFLWRYPWPLPSEGIRWADLLGFRRDEHQ